MIKTVEEGIEVYRSAVRDYLEKERKFKRLFPHGLDGRNFFSDDMLDTYEYLSESLHCKKAELKTTMEAVLKLSNKDRDEIWSQEKEKLLAQV